MQFRALQRERIRAALELHSEHRLQCGISCSAYRRSLRAGVQTRSITQAGRQLIDRALRLRAYALLSSAKLYLRIAFPKARLSYGRLPTATRVLAP